MQLGNPDTPPEIFDDFPHTLAAHASRRPLATLRGKRDEEQRLGGRGARSLRPQVLDQNGARPRGQRQGRFMPALAEDATEPEVGHDIPDIEGHALRARSPPRP